MGIVLVLKKHGIDPWAFEGQVQHPTRNLPYSPTSPFVFSLPHVTSSIFKSNDIVGTEYYCIQLEFLSPHPNAWLGFYPPGSVGPMVSLRNKTIPPSKQCNCWGGSQISGQHFLHLILKAFSKKPRIGIHETKTSPGSGVHHVFVEKTTKNPSGPCHARNHVISGPSNGIKTHTLDTRKVKHPRR